MMNLRCSISRDFLIPNKILLALITPNLESGILGFMVARRKKPTGNLHEIGEFSPRSAGHFYDALAPRYDWFSLYEARAKRMAVDCLDLAPGQAALNVGLGTGKYYQEVQALLGEQGLAVGIDLSMAMLRVAQDRRITDLVQSEGACLPFATESFDRLLCTYVLDLVTLTDLPRWLMEFRRVLKPGGRMVLVSLTEGVNLLSRGFVSVWKLAYRLSPVVCGGCRPLQLAGLVRQAGFKTIDRQVVLQLGVPSELLVAF
jgi:demethylmenaquinone methyltransferase/2-methoxy-6-polyprenyl-1,4-benzoquinol methylase